jgi:hypothetical protein
MSWYRSLEGGGDGARSVVTKSVGGRGGYGLSRVEAEIRSVSVERGAWAGSRLASLIPRQDIN